MLDGRIIQRIIALINLENLFVSFYIISADRERNHQFDAVGLAEVGQRSHLLGIKWTKDDVALVSALLQECIPDISINRNVQARTSISAPAASGFRKQQQTDGNTPPFACRRHQHYAKVTSRLPLPHFWQQQPLRLP